MLPNYIIDVSTYYNHLLTYNWLVDMPQCYVGLLASQQNVIQNDA